MPLLNNFPALLCLGNGSKEHNSHLSQQGVLHAAGKMSNSHKVFINSELFTRYPVVEDNESMIETVNTELTAVGGVMFMWISLLFSQGQILEIF